VFSIFKTNFKKEMSGRGRIRRVTIVARGGTGGLSLNDRFSQYKNKGTSPATRASRRGAMTARGNDARFSSLMEKRTGRKQPVNKTTSQNTFQKMRRGRGFGRGGSRGTTTFRGRGGRRGGGIRGGGIRRNASRGGRKKKQNVSQEVLDADLDSYMGGNEKVASQKLDDDLDAYMADRADPNVKA